MTVGPNAPLALHPACPATTARRAEPSQFAGTLTVIGASCDGAALLEVTLNCSCAVLPPASKTDDEVPGFKAIYWEDVVVNDALVATQ